MISVDAQLCELCGLCVGICPDDALRIEGNFLVIDNEACGMCQLCLTACPVGALSADK